MRKTAEAVRWIIGILRKHKVRFQISGGLAARVYGSNRPLADIDIEVPDPAVLAIVPAVRKHIIYGPKRYVDGEFDLLLMTLNYRGQEIDICGTDSQRLFDKTAKRWVKQKISLRDAKLKKAYGLFVPVIPLEHLIYYKGLIGRDVDLEDVENLKEKINS